MYLCTEEELKINLYLYIYIYIYQPTKKLISWHKH